MTSKNLKYELSKFYKSLKGVSKKDRVTRVTAWLIKNYWAMTSQRVLSKTIEDTVQKNNILKPKGTFCQTPDNCQTSYYQQIGDYYCSKCEKTGL